MSRWCPDCHGKQPYVPGGQWKCIHCGAVWARGAPADARSVGWQQAPGGPELQAARRLWASIEPCWRQQLWLAALSAQLGGAGSKRSGSRSSSSSSESA